jgi:hypothetical protein
MMQTMSQREDDTTPEAAAVKVAPRENSAVPSSLANPPDKVPTAYIPACGALCDAFWWAR